LPRSLIYALLWALLILVLCVMPPGNLPRQGWLDALHVDKFVHAAMFAVFFVLLVNGIQQQHGFALARKHPQWVAFLIAVAYGVFTEWTQEAMGLGRRADVADVLADTAGVFLGMAYLRWGEAWVAQQRKRWERYF
jgi:hypothetical protein